MFIFKNIKNAFLISNKRIKNFLLSKMSREFLIFLFFLFIATAFWLLRVLNDDYEIQIPIDVKMVDVPQNIIITQELPHTISIKIKDKGTVLIGYLIKKDFYPIVVDFRNYENEKSKNVTVNTNELEKPFISQLSPTTKILAIQPEKMVYIYSTGESRRIPIRIQGNIRPIRQYYITDTLIQPSYVTAYAPKQILNTLDKAYTNFITLTNFSSNINYEASIKHVTGVRFVPSTVKLTFKTDVFSEKNVEVPVQGINFPDNKRLLTFPSRVTVSFQVGSTLYKGIKGTDFLINVPYEELLNYKKEHYPLHLTKMPDGIRNVHITPPQVDFLIEQKVANVH